MLQLNFCGSMGNGGDILQDRLSEWNMGTLKLVYFSKKENRPLSLNARDNSYGVTIASYDGTTPLADFTLRWWWPYN
jgi:hypothetical protein